MPRLTNKITHIKVFYVKIRKRLETSLGEECTIYMKGSECICIK